MLFSFFMTKPSHFFSFGLSFSIFIFFRRTQTVLSSSTQTVLSPTTQTVLPPSTQTVLYSTSCVHTKLTFDPIRSIGTGTRMHFLFTCNMCQCPTTIPDRRLLHSVCSMPMKMFTVNAYSKYPVRKAQKGERYYLE